MIKITLYNGKVFTIHSKDLAKGTTTTRIYRRGLRNLLLANWYIVSANPV